MRSQSFEKFLNHCQTFRYFDSQSFEEFKDISKIERKSFQNGNFLVNLSRSSKVLSGFISNNSNLGRKIPNYVEDAKKRNIFISSGGIIVNLLKNTHLQCALIGSLPELHEKFPRKKLETAEFFPQIKLAMVPLLGMFHRTALDVTSVAKQETINQKTVYNWLARYKSGGLKALIPQHKKSGRKPAVYPSEVEDLCKAYINKHISLVSESNTEPIRKSWIRFNDDCLSKGWNPSQIPKIGTFYKKYRLIQENFIMKGQLSSSPAAIETKDAVNSPL